MKKNHLIAIIMSTFIAFTLAACGQSSSTTNEVNGEEGQEVANHSGNKKENLIIGTHPSGSAYNSTGSGVASVVTQFSPLQVTVQPYEGPNAWMPLLNNGEIDLGIISSPDLFWGIRGEHGHPEANSNVRALVVGNYPPTNGIVVREDSDILTTADLKGKKVAAGYAGNQLTQLLVEYHLNSVGLTWEDVEPVPVTSTPGGLEALQDGRVDAALGLSPVSATTLEVDAAVNGLRVLNLADIEPENFEDFPEDVAKKIEEGIPGTKLAVYEDIGILEGESALIYEYPIMLATTTHLHEENVYEILTALWENYEELHPLYAWLEDWRPTTMFQEKPPVPYHPGAIQFFKDQGLWTEDAEKHHQELLDVLQLEE